MARMTGSSRDIAGSRPRWLADWSSGDRMVRGGIKVDATAFASNTSGTVTIVDPVAQGDVTMNVLPLTQDIPAGTVVTSGTFTFTVTAKTLKGAMVLTGTTGGTGGVTDNSTGTYTTAAKTFIPSGTLLGRTQAEKDAGSPFGPWTSGDTDGGFLLFDIADVTKNNDGDLIRRNAQVIIDFLPEYPLVAAAKTFVEANFIVTRMAPR